MKAMPSNELTDVFLHKMPTSLLLTVRQYDRTYVSVLAKEQFIEDGLQAGAKFSDLLNDFPS